MQIPRQVLRNVSQIWQDSVLLGVLPYNCGLGAVNINSALKKQKANNHNIFEAYTALCRYKDK